jgi:hypothetical protein
MHYSIGPFNVAYVLIAILLLNFLGLYISIKKNYGLVGIATILIFPLVGALVMITYDLLNRKAIRK